MNEKNKVFRYLAYGIEIILVFVLQTTPNLLPEFFGEKAILLIPVALNIAYFEKEIPSMIFGVTCGIVIDLSSGNNIGFYAFFVTLVCFVVSQIFRDYIVVNFLNSLGFSTGIIFVVLTLHFILFYLIAGKSYGGFYYFHHYFPKIIYTILVSPLFYGLNKFLYKNLINS